MTEPSPSNSSGGPAEDVEVRRDRFLYVLVHELRNPLAPIQNAVEVLKLSRPVSDRVDRCSDLIDRQVSRMAQLLDNLVDVNRVAHGHFEIKVGRADLRSVMEQAVERAAPELTERGHTVVTDLPPAGLWLDGDGPRLVQLIAALLDNAAKFTDRGGTVTLGHSVGQGQVLITVADTGIGIDPAVEPLMYQPFMLAGSRVNRQGNSLGLGLPLAQGIANAHGGVLAARSRGPGQGTEFTLQLPRKTPVDALEHKLEDAHAGPAPERWRMVLADDRQLNADTLSELIRLQGHDVVTVYDGEAAVAAAQQIRPNVVVLDIGMPGVDGYEACRRIRAESWGRDIPIIALTGWGQANVSVMTREAGFTRHLLKPVDHITLLGNLEQLRHDGVTARQD